MTSTGSDLFSMYQDEVAENEIALERATDEESTLHVRLGEMAICANQQFNMLENPTHNEIPTHNEMTSMACPRRQEQRPTN